MNLITVLLQAAGGGGMSMLMMLGLIFLAMWFLLIRPQQKQRKKEQQFRASLTKGMNVITSSGIYGTVKDVTESYVMLEIAHNVIIKVNINFIYADGSVPNTESK